MAKLQKIRKTSLSKSSQAWVRRQLADPYVAKAQAAGYRARAAFKLLEIDERFHILKGRTLAADLGCAPGSWAQITAAKGIRTVGIDLLPCDPLAQVTFIQDDFTTEHGLTQVLGALGNQKPNLVMADMAANTVGHKETDGLRTQALTELAVDFALNHLAKGGHFTTKIFMNGYENEAKKHLTPHFERVQLFKPKSSRSESRETFLVALNKHN